MALALQCVVQILNNALRVESTLHLQAARKRISSNICCLCCYIIYDKCRRHLPFGGCCVQHAEQTDTRKEFNSSTPNILVSDSLVVSVIFYKYCSFRINTQRFDCLRHKHYCLTINKNNIFIPLNAQINIVPTNN